jgi:hypothetical protein
LRDISGYEPLSRLLEAHGAELLSGRDVPAEWVDSLFRFADVRSPFLSVSFSRLQQFQRALAGDQRDLRGRGTLGCLATFIARVCRERGIQIVSDEIYHGLSYVGPARSILEFEPDALVINSFSKYFSMVAWRLGWLVSPPDHMARARTFVGNLFLTAPSLSQHAGQCRADRLPLRADIEIETQVPVGIGALLEPALMHPPRAVEEHIERLGTDHVGNLRIVEHIEHPGLNAGDPGISAEQGRIHVGGNNLRTFCRHLQHACPTYALPCGGDQNPLALQPCTHRLAQCRNDQSVGG